jgi:hypothetical protein
VWVAEYRANKIDPDMVLVSAVIDKFNTCGSGAAGYVEAAVETGGLIFDVCQSNWGSFAADLGGASAAALNTFYLAATPDEFSIHIFVDGVEYTTGWHYDAVRVAVVADAVLPPGANVEIRYDAVGC